jgi:hypothetical protein
MNETIINSILNSIVNALLEALQPRIDKQIEEHLALTHKHIFELSQGMADRVSSLESSLNITQDVDPSDLNSLEERVKELEETKIDQGQLEDGVQQAISDYDFSSIVSDGIDDYDMDDKVDDAIRNNSDIVDEDRVKDMIDEAVSNLRISSK